MRHFLALLCVVLPSCIAWDGRQPVTPQRPTLSSDTSTTAEGTLELEVGGVLDPEESLDTPTSLKWGIGPRTDAAIGWSPYRWLHRRGPDAEGSGDLVMGVRHRFSDETEEAPALAFQLNTKLPTGDTDEGLSSGELDFFGALIASKDFGGFAGTLFYQAGVLGDPAAADTDIEHAIAIALGTAVTEEVGVFAEVATQVQPEADQDPVFVTAGMTYAVSPHQVLDVAVLVGLDDESPDFQILFGMTSNLGSLTAPVR